jgi:hypothetical protein
MATSPGLKEKGSTTPPFARLLATSLGVCVGGGALFGATGWLAIETLRVAGQPGGFGAFPLRLIVDGLLVLIVATVWALVVTVPFGIPAGAIAAGIIWWLRKQSWRPATRVGWVALGCITGLGVALAATALLSRLSFREADQILPIASGAGASCGAVLGWLVSPEYLGERAGRITMR